MQENHLNPIQTGLFLLPETEGLLTPAHTTAIKITQDNVLIISNFWV